MYTYIHTHRVIQVAIDRDSKVKAVIRNVVTKYGSRCCECQCV